MATPPDVRNIMANLGAVRFSHVCIDCFTQGHQSDIVADKLVATPYEYSDFVADRYTKPQIREHGR